MKNPMSLFKQCRKGAAMWIICAGMCLSVLVGCYKHYSYNYYEGNVTLSLSVEDLVFEAKGGWQEFTIDCSGEWTVTNGNEWCLPEMVSGSGKMQMKVMVEAYTGTDDRNATLTVKAGELVKTLTVTQKSADALILTKNKIEVPAEGKDISVEVKANVECTPIVPPAFQTWIKEAPVSKAMETKNFRFTVTANKDSLQREGYILIDGGELKDTVHIRQAAIRPDTDITDKFDPNFAQILQEKGYIKNANRITAGEVNQIIEVRVDNNNLTSLQGIEYFTELKALWCDNNNLSSLEVSKNTELTTLNCDNNNLSSLEVSKNTELTTLNCNNNNLSSLDVSKNTELTSLECHDNYLSSLEVSKNTKLKYLNCSDNYLSSLEVSKNTKLKYLNCSDNYLSSLEVSKNTKLRHLQCYDNPGTGTTFPLTVWTEVKPTQLYIPSTSWNYNDKEITIQYITKQ